MTATVDPDPPDILTIALCVILYGGDSFYDMEESGEVRLDWLRTFLRLSNGAPKNDTYNRVFQALELGAASSRPTRCIAGIPL